ncbi:ribonuclease H family protein [Schaalia sp. lx-100]|uniref:ribonuclease H family protein n=1 Tax=Schaalia sp. lx-100 TaxID=2899081 RepID=UPI001E6025C7|nr:ribonuclease H [Schaalia sp. lx-100]MCD4557918.1 ribonuclease HI [Schaalia sp. lx-100]
MTLTVAVDGSSLGNPGAAGWAWVLSEQCWDAGGWEIGTNNLGELNAIRELLRATEAAGLADQPLHILADSRYAIDVVTKWRHGWKKNGWKKSDKQPIKNLELIQDIDVLIAGRTVEFTWVKGHAGHPLNEQADARARACAQAYQDGTEPPTGPAFRYFLTQTPGSLANIDSQIADPHSHVPAPADDASSKEVSVQACSKTDDDMLRVIRDTHTLFLQAWINGDQDTVNQLCAPRCHRVWPNGQVTESMSGPVPSSLSVGRVDVRPLGESAWLVCHRIQWDSGSAFDLAVWEQKKSHDTPSLGRADIPTSRPVYLVHYQSTPIALS